MIRNLLTCLLLISIAFLAGCSTSPTESSSAPETNRPALIVASNYPLYYFAKRLAAEHAEFDIQLPVPTEGDPAFWQPDETAIATMQQADAVLLNGATYEKWLPTVSLPAQILVDTSAAFAAEYIELEIKHTHSHGADGEHGHGGTAFTTWLDMTKAEAQAKSVADTLTRLRPELQNSIEQNFTSLATDLRALDTGLIEATPNGRRQFILASHPVYDYLAKRYELRLFSLLWEPETMPSADDWKDFEFRKSPGVEWMIYEDEPSAEIRAELEKRGVKVCVFRPCGNRPPQGDFLTEMQANVERIRAVYTP